MYELADQLPRNTRSMPEAWPGIMDITAQWTEPEDITIKRIGQAYDYVDTLDGESVSEAYYYGLNSILPHFTQEMQKPEVRKGALKLAAFALATHPARKGTRNSGLHIDDLNALLIGQALLPVATTALDKLDIPESMATQITGANLHVRRNGKLTRKDGVDFVLQSDLPAYDIASAATAGITVVLKHRLLSGEHERSGRVPKTIAAVRPVDQLRGLLSDKAMRGFAGVRIDELLNDRRRHELVGLNRDGSVRFCRENLGEPPLDRLNTPIAPLHRKRLTCPALQVEGLIPTMIDFTMNVIACADLFVRDGVDYRTYEELEKKYA